ncbi:hypothetical protein Acr_00g0011370 [Actinidia rufa]|uniref:Uncharacterized protein n=1 Tax=Actinidia rufa TaxID=165716 RepID=A0A7J0DA29_9ERIC|nr:hypothetical protein Acr_00g0011370 [Actinidia rufa]
MPITTTWMVAVGGSRHRGWQWVVHRQAVEAAVGGLPCGRGRLGSQGEGRGRVAVEDGKVGAVVFAEIILGLAEVLTELGGGVEEVGTYASNLGLVQHEAAARE